MGKSAKSWASISAIFAVLLWVIRFISDLDFIVSRSQDPAWMMGIPTFFQSLYVPDWLIGGLAILSLVIVLYATRTSRAAGSADGRNAEIRIEDVVRTAFDKVVAHVYRTDSENNRAEQNPLLPNWRIGEAMEYVAKELGSENEHDVDAKYNGPAGLLTSKALAGEIQIWGKRLIAERKPELAQREIAPNEWNERELLIWACQPYTRKAQTRSVSQLATQQFTDLYVNKAQIKEISWRGENAYEVSQNAEQQYDTPIHEAVEYVARKIDDCDSGKCYPSARRGLRKAAFEGQIKVYGKRELKKGYHSDLRTPVPPEFWDDQELNELATSVAYTHHEHTRAELGDGFKKLGSDREKYWDVRVSMGEVKKEWP